MARGLMRREGGLSPFERFDPFEMMRDMLRFAPFRELEQGLRGFGMEGFTPSFDIKETKDAYEVCADLPGLKEEDIDVSLSGSRLTISGEREQEEKKEDETWYAVERRHGSFSRSFMLPDDVDPERCEASFEDGVLRVHLAKQEEARPKHIKLFGKHSGGKPEGGEATSQKERSSTTKTGNGKGREARA